MNPSRIFFLGDLCVLAVVTCLLLSGCAASPNRLTLTGLDRRHDFHQVFSHAYSALNDNGDYDVVLVHDANSDGLQDSDGALQPSTVTPRQLVHIRVFWLPEYGSKMEHAVSTNASIRWYVFGDRPDEGRNLLEYSGSALVFVNESGGSATVTVRGARLKVIARRGDMADPLGPSTVDGTVITRVNRRNVDDLLREAKSAEDSGAVQAASAGQN